MEWKHFACPALFSVSLGNSVILVLLTRFGSCCPHLFATKYKKGAFYQSIFWTCGEEVKGKCFLDVLCTCRVLLGNYTISSVKHLATGHNPLVWTVRASNKDFSQFGLAAKILLLVLMEPFLSACRHCTRN